ncbi:cation:dicarboxylase symporter family transporter [Anaplasma phagocytophilum str. Norway variant1]|uniref:Cation:dicarboxylase symporter family transporter n=1 Tax=Anaplasma phagocytophilum str. Norway variant1 TaxID=1392506 RepID=A0A7H9DYW8_ANAPH|nr:cation:dicarboxylase symporter family transporter [Anaplasma phagocytophilum]QLL66727.1 cation:dicarboxylase symporter family transporter [Anaplasma phagocytophilum str. Norway variant1]SCV65508.1 Sodium:dicarboxylate symporter family protein [Anaplasma phagocytophilum]
MSHSLRFLFLFLLVASAFLLGDMVPYKIQSLFYTVSLYVKECLVFILPFVVFSIIFHSTSQLHGSSAVKVTFLLFSMVLLSNTLSVGISHFLSVQVLDILDQEIIHSSTSSAETLLPAYPVFTLPSIMSCAKALALGFVAAIILQRIFGDTVLKVSEKLYSISVFTLEKIFSPVIPVFIVGFTFKIRSDGALDIIANNYVAILYICIPALAYVVLLYFIGNGGSLNKTAEALKNMLPAALTGFTTMSSLLTMPITLAAVKKSTNNPNLADIAVPGSVNIHLLGDCFFTVVLLSLMASAFGTMDMMSTSDYLLFLFYVVIMKFAEAAVAGTGLLLMFPVMEKYLHFTPVMLSLSTTVYILLDPIITVLNILGNGAFSILFIKANKLLFGGSTSPKPKSKS